MCFEHVLKVFSMFLVGLKIKSHICFAEKMVSEKGELIGSHVFCVVFHLNRNNISKSDKHIDHIPCNEAAEKLKAQQRIRNSASTKSNPTVIFVDV